MGIQVPGPVRHLKGGLCPLQGSFPDPRPNVPLVHQESEQKKPRPRVATWWRTPGSLARGSWPGFAGSQLHSERRQGRCPAPCPSSCWPGFFLQED